MQLKYVNGKDMKINTNNLYDEYFTNETLAKKLFEKTKKIISKYENISKYTWIEPSVGNGDFYKILPKQKIGIDIKPTKYDTIKKDYLKYDLPDKPIIVIGNPPFGHRGVMALNFILHSQKADFIAFILPMFFQSVGKGSIRYRVKGFNLIYEEMLPEDSFYVGNKTRDIKCCFQIWSKKYSLKKNEFSWYNNTKNEPYEEILKVITVSLAKNRECGKEYIFNKKANYYLSSSYFKENHVVKKFDDVKYKSGIAIIYKTKDKQKIKQLNNIFINVDWNKYSSLATNGCRHIGKSHIFQLLLDKGI